MKAFFKNDLERLLFQNENKKPNLIVSQIASSPKNTGFVKMALRPVRIARFNPVGENDFIDAYSECISILNIRQKSLLANVCSR